MSGSQSAQPENILRRQGCLSPPSVSALGYSMAQPGSIVAVCTANICRSPMAAALLSHALAAQPEPLRSLRVVSAGVAARSGDLVSANSVVALKKVGLDIAGQRSQPLTAELVNDAVALVCMTESHRALIHMLFNPPPRNVFLFREFMPVRSEREIADPFGGPLDRYETCRDELVEALPSLVAFLKTIAAKRTT